MTRTHLIALLLIAPALVGCTSDVAPPAPQADSGDHDHDHDHGHDHPHTPHHGIQAPFMMGDKKTGVAELKLHDDKGDLELWLTQTKVGKHPFDLPADAKITVTFPQLEGKTVTLQVRNTDKNEDEDGNANLRDGKTNYFIFPGDTGADATWLLGKEFASEAVISFMADGVEHATEAFLLKPHTH